MNYGKAIKIIRNARGLSQKELARLLKKDASVLSIIESGQRKPNTETLELISKALNVPFYLLILMASDPQELKGINSKDAQKLGAELLGLLLSKK